MADVLLELRDLCVRAPNRVLVEGVGFTVRAGRVTALCGPSGAGKSLSARASMGVVDVLPGLAGGSLRYPAHSGDRDWYAGHANTGERGQRALLESTRVLRGGYMTYSPQAASSALNPGRTIGRQLEIAVARRATPVAEAERPALYRALLAEVGLAPWVAGSVPGELSGGMCQRAALAIAMAPAPKVLIADEPETGLDPVLRRQVVELLVAVGKAHGCGILLISHHEDTVERIADDVVRLTPPAGASEVA
jgi:ABC-type glutathione transport system ATPase component